METVEVERQIYTGNNCTFSSGLVFDPDEIETIYLRVQKDGDEPYTLYLRTDEAARIAALLSNAIWSMEVQKWTPKKIEL
jgi:hypothetical protein